MYTSGQTINYDKYIYALQNTPAPILCAQLPSVKIDMAGLIEYAHEKGVKVGDLSEEEKNRFIDGDIVQSLQGKLKLSIKYKSLAEWNSSIEG